MTWPTFVSWRVLVLAILCHGQQAMSMLKSCWMTLKMTGGTALGVEDTTHGDNVGTSKSTFRHLFPERTAPATRSPTPIGHQLPSIHRPLEFTPNKQLQ